ncbi:MAG: hypothetical protein HQ581_16140 [Planctomycetes bacterium]|nr:hypothetical protein [Planctomycetota bacterium]
MLDLAPRWELDLERGPDWLFIKVRNLADHSMDAPLLAEQLWSHLQQHSVHRLLLELEGLTLLNSGLIGQLVMLHRRIDACGGMMRICGLSAYNMDVLHRCRLAERLHPYQDRQEAVLGFLSRKPR